MYRKYYILLILSFFCIFSHKAHSRSEDNRDNGHQEEEYYCKSIGIAEGLSQSSITSLAYDSHGSLWIGTRYGLNEYRNQTVRNILDSGKEGLKGNYIHHLFIDSEETLWVSTDKGISGYSHNTDSFSHISDLQAYSAYQDTTGIYFGTNKGLLLYKSGETELIPLENAYINAIYPYKDKILAVDKGLGLWIFDGKELTKLEYPELESAIILTSLMSDEMLYLSIYRKGFCILDFEKGIRFYDSSNSELSFDVILSMLEKDDEIWMGTDGGGINAFSPEDSSIRHINVPSSSITTLYSDPYSNVWAGSVRSGLYGLRPSRIISYDSSGEQLTNDIVISLAEGRDDNIWIGTDGGGINTYNKKTGEIKALSNTSGLKVSSLVELPEGKLLVSSYSKGLNILDVKTGQWSPFVLVDNTTNYIECFYGNSPLIYETEQGCYLIMAINIYEYDPSDGSFSRFQTSDGTLASEMKLCGKAENNYYVWSPEGIFSLDLSSHLITKLPVTISGKTITSAVTDFPFIWIGTSDGLYSYNIKNNRTQFFNTSLFKRITHIQSEAPGHIWIAADNILFRRTPGRIEIIGENEGVAANELLTGITSTHNGEDFILLGGTNGLVKIRPVETVTENKMDNKIHLYNVSVGGERTKVENNQINLPSKFPSIKISIALSLSDPFNRYVYRYRLNGKSSYSIETYDDFLILPDLKEGSYNMSASYLKNDGVWSEPMNVIQINVRPPWYRSTLFNIACILILLAAAYYIGYIIYKEQMRKIEKRIREENSDFIQKLNAYILGNLDNPQLDIPSIAMHMATSRASLYARVKKIIGKGVGQYIDDLRIKEACNLLENGNMSVAEIADRVGYSSSRYFSTRFKQQTGLTPREYRTRNKKDDF